MLSETCMDLNLSSFFDKCECWPHPHPASSPQVFRFAVSCVLHQRHCRRVSLTQKSSFVSVLPETPSPLTASPSVRLLVPQISDKVTVSKAAHRHKPHICEIRGPEMRGREGSWGCHWNVWVTRWQSDDKRWIKSQMERDCWLEPFWCQQAASVCPSLSEECTSWRRNSGVWHYKRFLHTIKHGVYPVKIPPWSCQIIDSFG